MRAWTRAALVLAAALCAAAGLAAGRGRPSEGANPALHGCPLYTRDDWFTTNLRTGASRYASNGIDPHSAAIIANLRAAYPQADFGANVDPELEAINLVPPVAARARLSGLAYGFNDDPSHDDPPPYTIPLPPRLYQEGTRGCSSGSGDCHVIVLDTRRCIVWETYNWDGASWNGTSFAAKAGYVHNLRRPFNDQYRQDTAGPTAAHTPLVGTTDWGEEASLPAIRHILGFFLGKPGLANGGFVAPATAGQPCTAYCAAKLPYGARLRLRAGFRCPKKRAYPQAHLICRQMKDYGIIFDDTTGLRNGFGIRLGLSSDGTNPWRRNDYGRLLDRLKIRDFDVMALGTVRD